MSAQKAAMVTYMKSTGLVQYVDEYQRIFDELIREHDSDLQEGRPPLPLVAIPGRAWTVLMRQVSE